MQNTINLAVKIAIPIGLGLLAWLFGTVFQLSNRTAILETREPIILQQLDRIEKKLDRLTERGPLAE